MKKIVLLRHGESAWNRENRFTGWTDVDLTDKGVEEALKAGELLKAERFRFGKAYTSYLKRAVRTLNCVLDRLDQEWIPVEKNWRLNEKHYGVLQGLNKSETAAFCKEHDILVEAWSPLGSGKLLEDPKLKEFGQKYGRSTAQICLRWCLQKGHLPLPKSVTPVRIKENLQLFDFQISQEDMAVIDKLECVGRTGSDPDNAKF